MNWGYQVFLKVWVKTEPKSDRGKGCIKSRKTPKSPNTSRCASPTWDRTQQNHFWKGWIRGQLSPLLPSEASLGTSHFGPSLHFFYSLKSSVYCLHLWLFRVLSFASLALRRLPNDDLVNIHGLRSHQKLTMFESFCIQAWPLSGTLDTSTTVHLRTTQAKAQALCTPRVTDQLLLLLSPKPSPSIYAYSTFISCLNSYHFLHVKGGERS